MADEFGTISWYAPDPRCIFDLDHIHVPKRLARTYRSGMFEPKINTAWDQVIRLCADRDTTWISDEIISSYTQLHRLGYAHSVEVYKNGALAGGLYGVSIRGAFFGESMFHIETDASKVALLYLVEHMRERGMTLLDSQYMTTHLSKFGAVLIPKAEYMKRLERALNQNCSFV